MRTRTNDVKSGIQNEQSIVDPMLGEMGSIAIVISALFSLGSSESNIPQ